MALQVWLPLNRDIRDIGLSSTNPINNGTTINNSGIFEKCYEFNSSKTIYITNFNLSSTEFSVSCWVNIVSSIGGGSAEYIVCLNNNNYSGDMQFAIFHRTRTLTIIVNNTEYTVQALDLNAWYHIVLTFANKISKIYINGTLVNTRTISSNAYTGHNLNVGSRSSANDGSAHAYYANVLVNDVRIYDNALTEEDVERIYQQKLFEFYPKECKKNWLNNANVKNEYGWSSYGFGSKGIGEVTNEVAALRTTNRLNIRNGNTDNVIKITTKYSGETTSASEIARSVSGKKISDNEFMTFSFYAKGEGTSVGRVIRPHVYCAKAGDSSTVLSTGTDYRLTSEWKRYAHAFKWTKGGTTNGSYNCYIVPYLAKNEHVYVCNFQFEEGSGATEYNNSINERNLIFEKSGFLIKNDLVCSGVTFSGNTAIFNGTSDIIKSKTAGLSISGGTLSIWFFIETKPSTTQLIYLDGNNRMAFGLYNNASVIIVSTKISSPTYPASSVVYGSWNHVAITYGTNYVATNCYLNGVKLTSSGSDSWSNGNSFLEIGGRVYYSQYFKGSIKNIKIFKKQLSEEEILELYRQNGN